MLTGGGYAVGLVQMTETINRYGSANWDLFATQVKIQMHAHAQQCGMLSFQWSRRLTAPADCSAAMQNYFDKHGVFMSSVVSLPLLLMSAFMVRLSPHATVSPPDHSRWCCNGLLGYTTVTPLLAGDQRSVAVWQPAHYSEGTAD